MKKIPKAAFMNTVLEAKTNFYRRDKLPLIYRSKLKKTKCFETVCLGQLKKSDQRIIAAFAKEQDDPGLLDFTLGLRDDNLNDLFFMMNQAATLIVLLNEL